MKKNILISFILISNICTSQDKIPFIDFEDINNKIENGSQEIDYEKSLELLNKISKNDSVYCSVLVTKSYYLLNLKKYDTAIKIANQGLSNNCGDSNLSFYINKGIAYVSKDEYEEAINVYNKGLVIYPNNYQLWYNKGVALEYLEKIEEAVTAYQNAILLNPTYRKPHLQLGNLCYKQERIAQALMCYNMYLLLKPDGEAAFGTLKSLNNLVEIKNENTANPDIQLSNDDDYFDDIDLIISNKIALNKKYNTGNKIKIALTKQNHILIEQLKDFEGGSGFWDTKYVPFFKWISRNNLFDKFTYTLSYSIQNEKYKKIINQNKKDIKSFIEAFNEKWEAILTTNTIDFEGKEQEITYNYYNSYVQAMGKKINTISIGNWQFYNSNGQLTSLGAYNNKGNRAGKWTWFYINGKIKETANYLDGKLQGDYFLYHENGRLHITSFYANDKLDGEYKYYSDKGALIQKKYFKTDKLEGLYQSYFVVGEQLVEFKTPYLNDLVTKKSLEYYANGDIYSEIEFLNGKRNGLEKKYHFNKKLSAKINYLDGELSGGYKTFYSNGNIFENGQSLNNFYHGPWKTFYWDGNLQSTYTYNKGSLDGIYKYFDTDGIINYEYLYRKGEIITYKFYNKEGGILKEERKKGGEFYYKGFYPNGNLTSEGLYDISGGKKGLWKFYSKNGVLTEKGNYTNNKVDGEYINYHNNGEKLSVSLYKEGSLTGYYTDYYKNGILKNQGWYKDNLFHGEWRYYFSDGTLKNINFYHKNQLHGNQEYYTCDGKLDVIYNYKYGELISETSFDIEKKEYNYVNYAKNNNSLKLVFKHFNHNTSSEITYINGIKHGEYKYFNYYGKNTVIGNYTNGEQDGEWIWYYENSDKIESQRQFLNGSVNGKSLNYYKDGTIMSEHYYNYGKETGTWKYYNDNGTKATTTEYENGVLHGRKEFFSYLGKLQLVRFYNHGTLIGYSYLDKNSNELPMIKIKNETAKIKAYFNNGNVSREFEYINGDLVNTYNAYYYSGQLENEIGYLSNEYNGMNIEYFQDGTIKKKEEYLLGNLHGTVKEFYKNGILKEEVNYLNSTKSGSSKYFNKKGKLIKKELYFNGNIYSSETY